jgi:hypothetical protein
MVVRPLAGETNPRRFPGLNTYASIRIRSVSEAVYKGHHEPAYSGAS